MILHLIPLLGDMDENKKTFRETASQKAHQKEESEPDSQFLRLLSSIDQEQFALFRQVFWLRHLQERNSSQPCGSELFRLSSGTAVETARAFPTSLFSERRMTAALHLTELNCEYRVYRMWRIFSVTNRIPRRKYNVNSLSKKISFSGHFCQKPYNPLAESWGKRYTNHR